MSGVKRDWAKIMTPWIASRKVDGKHLRDAVWKEMAPLRLALSPNPTGGDDR